MQLVAASPAAAATACVPLAASTPGLTADVDGDGTDDVTVPALSGATLCVGANVVLSGPPTIEREQCGGFGSCMTYYVTYELTGYAEADATLCYTADGVPTCASIDLARVPLDLVRPQTMCFGWDLRGGFPCPSGQPIEVL